MARVAVVFTGGTISTAYDPAAGGNVPVLDGAAILARTPGLDAIADVVPIDRGRTPASHFTFPVLLDIAARPADGPGRPVDRRRGRGPGHGHDRGDQLLLGPRPGRPEAGRGHRRDAGIGRGRLRRTGQPARRDPGGRSGVDARRRRGGLPGWHDRARGRRDQDARLGDGYVRQPERRLARPRRRVGRPAGPAARRPRGT